MTDAVVEIGKRERNRIRKERQRAKRTEALHAMGVRDLGPHRDSFKPPIPFNYWTLMNIYSRRIWPYVVVDSTTDIIISRLKKRARAQALVDKDKDRLVKIDVCSFDWTGFRAEWEQTPRGEGAMDAFNRKAMETIRYIVNSGIDGEIYATLN